MSRSETQNSFPSSAMPGLADHTTRGDIEDRRSEKTLIKATMRVAPPVSIQKRQEPLAIVPAVSMSSVVARSNAEVFDPAEKHTVSWHRLAADVQNEASGRRIIRASSALDLSPRAREPGHSSHITGRGTVGPAFGHYRTELYAHIPHEHA